MALSFGSSSFATLPQGGHRTAGQYYLNDVFPSGPFREWQESTAPGTDGTKVTLHGFRFRRIGPYRCLHVATTQATLESDIETVITNVGTGGVTVTTPGGGTYDNCYLEDGYPQEIGGSRRKSEAGSTWYCEVEYRLIQREE